MENSLLDSNLTEENYDDYIEKIFNIFRLSSKNSSIILSVDIVDSKCLIKLKIVSQNGDTKEFSDVTFKCDNAFYNDFLDSLIKRLNDDENFIINDIVNLDKDEFMTFRLVSSNNDLITIDGLTKEQAAGTVRFTLGKENTQSDIDYTIRTILNTAYNNKK